MEEISDIELIKKYIKENDEESFHILIKKYIDYVYNFIHTYVNTEEECEDITQETFVKVWKNIKKFKQDKNFKTWLFEIAKNTALDYLKKKKNINFSELNKKEDDKEVDIIETIEDESETILENLERKDDYNIIKNIIEELSFKYKQVINLYFFNEFNFREISEILGESIDTIKSRYRRAIIILKEKIKTLR